MKGRVKLANKILIINLDRNVKALCIGHLVQWIQHKHYAAEVSVLVEKTEEEKIRNLKNIKNIYVLDRQKMQLVKNSSLFNDGLALKEFMLVLSEIKNTRWDILLNVGSDSASASLVSYLTKGESLGARLGPQKRLEHSGYWPQIYHSLLHGAYGGGMNVVEALHKMTFGPPFDLTCGLTWPVEGDAIAPTSGNINGKLRAFVADVQQKRRDTPSSTKMVGVMGGESNFELLHESGQGHGILPILVEKDKIKALPHLVGFFDAVILCGGEEKILCDLMKVPTIEVLPEKKDLFLKSTMGKGNIVISSSNDNTAITAVDLLHACSLLFNQNQVNQNQASGYNGEELSAGITFYRVFYQKGRCEYLPVAGPFDVFRELSRFIAKDMIYYCAHGNFDHTLFNTLYKKMFSPDEIKAWVNQENEKMAKLHTFLINALRGLGQCRKGQDSSHWDDLERDINDLSSLSEEESAVAIPLALFRQKIQLIDGQDIASHLDDIEQALFCLKNDLNKLLLFIHSFSGSMERTKPRNYERV